MSNAYRRLNEAKKNKSARLAKPPAVSSEEMLRRTRESFERSTAEETAETESFKRAAKAAGK